MAWQHWAICIWLISVACNQQGESHAPPAAPAVDDEQRKFDAARRPDQIVQALDARPGAVIADVGAGSGLMTIHLARAVRPGGKIVATDIDRRVLAIAEKRLHDAGVADVLETLEVEADLPGLTVGSFDGILLSEVDHYFQAPEQWLRAAAAALRPSGRIVVSNRIHHRARTVSAFAKAGLRLLREDASTPSHYLLVYVPQ